MRCDHCPAPIGAACRGEKNPIWCRHVDPADELYDPRYIRIVVADEVQLQPDLVGRLDRAYAEHGAEPALPGCGRC